MKHTSKRLLALALCVLMIMTLLPVGALADLPADADPDAWDSLVIKKADGSDAVLGADFTKVKVNDYSASGSFLQVYKYTILTADPITISGGGSWYYSDYRTEKAKVEIASSVKTANITLKNVAALASITVPAGKSASFTLVGNNFVDEILGGNATGTEATLTFGGTGSLTGNRIGGSNTLAPKIVINDGNYVLNGGYDGWSCPSGYGAAIGGASGVSVDGITINGGTISAKSNYGAAIGGGQDGYAKNITINDGDIKAKGSYGAAIGGGQNGIGENITITGGKLLLTASRGGIGGGQNGDAKNIKISGGDITIIDGAGGGALIGAGQDANADGIEITGGKLVLNAKPQSSNIRYWGVCIGAGSNSAAGNTTAKNITITNADINCVINHSYDKNYQNKGYGFTVGTPEGTADATSVSINCGVYNGKQLPVEYIAEGYSSYQLSNNTYIIGKTDTVTVTDGKLTGGTFAFDPSAYVDRGSCYAKDNEDGTWTVTKFTVNVGGETEATVETKQISTVDETEIAAVVEDEEVQKAIKQSTEVKGVELTVTAEASKTSGLQAVVEAAKEQAETAIKEASEIKVIVDVQVTPIEYDKKNNTVEFDLTPLATVKVNDAVVADNIKVTNDMINQDQDIYVTIYTGFKPAQIVHRDNDGKVIEVFGEGDFTYDESSKTATVIIHHFSTLEAMEKVYVAQVGDTKYESFKEAIDAVQDGQTVKLLSDVTFERIRFDANNKKVVLDLGGYKTNGRFDFWNGDLTIKNGKMTLAGDQPLNVYGNSADGMISHLTVAEDVTVEGGYALGILNMASATYSGTCYGLTVDWYGKAVCDCGLFVSGNIARNGDGATESYIQDMVSGKIAKPKINIYATAYIKATEDVAVALNGFAEVNVNGGTLEGREAVGVKRGILNVYDGNLIAHGDKVYPIKGVNSGTDPSGAAVSVSSFYANYSGTMVVNIYGGNLVSDKASAVVIGHAENDKGEKNCFYKDGVSLNIEGGNFTSASGEPCVIFEKDIEGDGSTYTDEEFISGGTFSGNIDKSYLDPDMHASVNEKGEFVVKEHTYADVYTVDLAPTCTADGSKSKHCTDPDCTAKTEVTPIPAIGHKWSVGVLNGNTITFTCVNKGCGKSYTVDLDNDKAICDQKEAVAPQNGSFELVINGKSQGFVTVTKSGSGYTISGVPKGEFGNVWQYADGHFYQSKTEKVSRGFFLWNILFGRKEITTTYYLSVDASGSYVTNNTGAQFAAATLYKHTYRAGHDFSGYTALGNGTHVHSCVYCGLKADGSTAEPCSFVNGVCQFCGTQDPKTTGYINVKVDMHKTGFLFFKLYMADISVSSDIVGIKKVEYSVGTGGLKYTTGLKVMSTRPIYDIIIVVTATDGAHGFHYNASTGTITPYPLMK